MPRPTTRRHFLQTAVTAGAAVGLGEWAKLLPLSPATADEVKVTPDLVRFSPDIEPIVRLIEETPREKCVAMMIGQLEKGLPNGNFLAGLDPHQIKFPIGASENYGWVSPEWRPHLLAAASYVFIGADALDTDLAKQVREAVRKL